MAIQGHPSNPIVLIPAILELEKRIGYAELVPISMQELIAKEKQYFYIFYAMEALEFQT